MSSETPWIEPVTEPVPPKRTNQQLRREAQRRVEDRFDSTLSEEDRNAVKEGHLIMARYKYFGISLGLFAGLLGAHRLRANKIAMLRAIRAQERPLHVVFASGRTGTVAQPTQYFGLNH